MAASGAAAGAGGGGIMTAETGVAVVASSETVKPGSLPRLLDG